LETLNKVTEINNHQHQHQQTTTDSDSDSISLDYDDLIEGDDDDDDDDDDDASRGSIHDFVEMPSLVSFCGDSFVSYSSHGGHSSLSSFVSSDLPSLVEDLALTIGSTLSSHSQNNSSSNTATTAVPPTTTNTTRSGGGGGGSILSSKCHSYQPDVMPRRESRWQTEWQNEEQITNKNVLNNAIRSSRP
jgi:hypothetical protein